MAGIHQQLLKFFWWKRSFLYLL